MGAEDTAAGAAGSSAPEAAPAADRGTADSHSRLVHLVARVVAGEGTVALRALQMEAQAQLEAAEAAQLDRAMADLGDLGSGGEVGGLRMSAPEWAGALRTWVSTGHSVADLEGLVAGYRRSGGDPLELVGQVQGMRASAPRRERAAVAQRVHEALLALARG